MEGKGVHSGCYGDVPVCTSLDDQHEARMGAYGCHVCWRVQVVVRHTRHGLHTRLAASVGNRERSVQIRNSSSCKNSGLRWSEHHIRRKRSHFRWAAYLGMLLEDPKARRQLSLLLLQSRILLLQALRRWGNRCRRNNETLYYWDCGSPGMTFALL